MKILGKFVVNDVYKSTKNANTYYTMSDLDNGSQIKMTVDGEMKDVNPGNMVSIEAEVKTRLYKEGGQSITFQQGNIKKL